MSQPTSGNGGKERAAAQETLSADSDFGSRPTERADVDLFAADVLARGATVGRYLVLERLGAGAMGIV